MWRSAINQSDSIVPMSLSEEQTMAKFSRNRKLSVGLCITGLVTGLIGCSKGEQGDESEGSSPTGESPQPNPPTAENPQSTASTSTSGTADDLGIPVGVTAGVLNIKGANLAFNRWSSGFLRQELGLSTTVPDLTAGEYLGMGINYGESVVDGFKVRLTGVFLGTGQIGQLGGQSVSIFDWVANPREIEISAGLNTAVSDSKTLVINAGIYTYTTIVMERNFDVKAYAYLDTDADGTIDSTIYTKATGVVKVPNIVSHENLLQDKTLAYDYFRYDFMYNGPKTNDPAGDVEFFGTQFVRPISICATPKTPPFSSNGNPAAGAGALTPPATTNINTSVDCTEVSKLQVDLLIDTVRVVKAWDGRFGDQNVTPAIPNPGMPFPNSSNPTNGATYGFNAGEPAFGLTYLPVFAFVSAGTDDSSKVTSETYMLSQYPPNDAHFNFSPTYRFSVIYDSKGKPIMGKSQANSPDIPVYVGMAARVFEESPTVPNTYSFYTSGTGVPADGDVTKNDGGLDYHDDKSMAGHRFDGFQSLATIGQTIELKQFDGPRCDARLVEKKMHEDMNNPLSCSTANQSQCASDPLYAYETYNHCVEFRRLQDTSFTTDFVIGSDGKTWRKVYLTRVR